VRQSITPFLRLSMVLSWLAAFAVWLLCMSLGLEVHAAPKTKKKAVEVYSAEDPDASPADEAALLGAEGEEISSDLGNAWAEVEDAKKDAPEAPVPDPVQIQVEVPAVPPAPSVPQTESEPLPPPPPAAASEVEKKAPKGWGMFDPVPAKNRKMIAERLRLTEILIKKYGRAYDYRVHTVKQLRQILKLLEESRP
jgi:hypothetical protein